MVHTRPRAIERPRLAPGDWEVVLRLLEVDDVLGRRSEVDDDDDDDEGSVSVGDGTGVVVVVPGSPGSTTVYL